MDDKMVIMGHDGKSIYIKHPYKGNYGSGTWDDGAGDLIKHILIGYDDNIVYSIQTTYQRKGEIVLSSLHGERQGNLAMISLNEPLTWISGHYGSYCIEPDIFVSEEDAPYNYTKAILSLKFGTASTTYGPYGSPGGEPFSFITTTGIGGFHGCIDHFLSAIGVYVQIPTESSSINKAPPEKSVKLEK